MKKYDAEKFSKNLRKLRQQKGLSQKALSEQAGVSLYWIQVCEKGKGRRGLGQLVVIADFFDVTTDDLCIEKL